MKSSIGRVSSERFKSLFSTPPLLVSILLNIAIYLVLIPLSLQFIISEEFVDVILEFSIPALTALILSFTLTSIGTPIAKTRFIRRVLAYPLYTSLIILPSLLVLSLSTIVYDSIIPLYFTVSPTSSILYILSRSITERGPLRSLAYSLTIVIPLVLVASRLDYITLLILGCILASIGCEAYFRTILLVGRRSNVGMHLELFRAFAKEWLAEDSSEIESKLESIGEDREGFVKLLLLRGSSMKVLVQASYHTGPIRGIGGSKLSHAISKALRNEGVEAIVLHPPSNHSLDPASKTESSKLVKRIIECIESPGWEAGYMRGKPFIISRGVWSLHVYPYHPAPLIFIYREEGIDDLPPKLNFEARREAKTLNFKDCVLVESHNSIPLNLKVESRGLEDLKVLIREAIVASASLNNELDVKAGMAKVSKEEIGRECYDICSDGVSALVMEVKGEKYLLVTVDGNNMDYGFRREIEELGYKLGYKIVTVTTTDSHELTGRITGTSGYIPVGRACKHKILNAILNALKRAEDNIEDVRVEFKSCRIDKLRVLGLKGTGIIERVLEGPAKYASRTLFLTLLLLNTVTTLVMSMLVTKL